MNHASLETGIGGFDLAAEWMGWTNIFQCEIDSFCNKLLTQNFPNTIKHGDIRTTDFSIYRGQIDVLSAGFPCQPYSTAGKRLGKADERHLWPENYRAVREIQPPWVVGENVRGLTNWNGGLVFDEVQADLEAAGYEVTPFLLPAAGVNAPHRRDRIFFIAYSDRYGHERRQRGKDRLETEQSKGERDQWERIRANVSGIGTEGAAANANHSAAKRFREDSGGILPLPKSERLDLVSEQDDTDSDGERLEELQCKRGNNESKQQATQRDNYWWQDWPTQPGIRRGDDGLSNRVHRLKGLGNAVVPQVVLQIFKAIESYEKAHSQDLG